VGPRAGLYVVAKRKIPYRELNPGRPARSLVTTLTQLSIPAPLRYTAIQRT